MTEQDTVPHQAALGSDEHVLLARLRGGEDAAFGELFERHVAAVRRLARSLASDASEAEDITAETFFRVLQALRRGAGPRDYVRAYLLTVARRVSWEWHGARRDVPVSDDELTFRAGAGADANALSAEHTLITTAFTSLPERWRTVLWQTEVEGEQPAMVAPHFGLSANATAALARRARQGLRAAYLQAHLSVSRSSDACRAVVEKLGGYTAGSVSGAEARRIGTHLLGCSSCRATEAELRDVCSSLRAHAGVLVFLVPAAGLGVGSAGSAAGGIVTAMKSLWFGSKLKVGLALASTAAAGAFGIAVGPAVFGPDSSQPISLPGGGDHELIVAEPAPPAVVPPKATVGIGTLSVHAPDPGMHTVRRPIGVGFASGVGLPMSVMGAGSPVAGLMSFAAAQAAQQPGPAQFGPVPRVDLPMSDAPGRLPRKPTGTKTPTSTTVNWPCEHKPAGSESTKPRSDLPGGFWGTRPFQGSFPRLRLFDWIG